jgi:hypothetical protein
MTERNHAGRLLPLALCASGVISAALAGVFWSGLIDVGESRLVVTAIVAAIACAELFMGLFLLSLSRT